MIYQLEDLQQAYRSGAEYDFLFFWGHRAPASGGVNASCLSQWWPCSFELGNECYTCAEQYMMAEKARLFGDNQMVAAIMGTRDPKAMKAYGRAIKGYNQAVWEQYRYAIVKRGNEAKFRQNDELWAYIKTTAKRILVEASPVDPVWGIGLAGTDPDARNPLKWQGTNLLGFALTEVRDERLKEEEALT